VRIFLMPNQEQSRPHNSDDLQADIKRLSKHSERLRKEAMKNAEQADAIVKRIREIEQRLVESKARKGKKTSGRIG